MFTLKSLTRLVQMLCRMTRSLDVKMRKKLPIDTNSVHSNEYCRYVDVDGFEHICIRCLAFSHKYRL